MSLSKPQTLTVPLLSKELINALEDAVYRFECWGDYVMADKMIALIERLRKGDT